MATFARTRLPLQRLPEVTFVIPWRLKRINCRNFSGFPHHCRCFMAPFVVHPEMSHPHAYMHSNAHRTCWQLYTSLLNRASNLSLVYRQWSNCSDSTNHACPMVHGETYACITCIPWSAAFRPMPQTHRIRLSVWQSSHALGMVWARALSVHAKGKALPTILLCGNTHPVVCSDMHLNWFPAIACFSMLSEGCRAQCFHNWPPPCLWGSLVPARIVAMHHGGRHSMHAA